MAGSTGQDLVNQWTAKHGDIVGQPYAVNPTMKDSIGRTVPNDNPTYRYQFADGSFLETDSSGAVKNSHEASAPAAKQPSSVNAPPSEQYLLTRDPTSGQITTQPNPNYVAPKPGAPAQPATHVIGNKIYQQQPDGSFAVVLEGDKAPRVIGGTASTDKQLIIEDANGNRSYIPNPNYVPPRPTQLGTNTTDKYIVQQNPDGTTTRIDNPNYVPAKPTQIGTNTTDRYILQQNPDGTVSQIDNPNYVAPKPVLAAGGTASDQYIVTMAPDGTLTNQPNPNYQPPKPDVLSPNTVAPYIPIVSRDPNSDTGYTVTWQPNQNQQTVRSSMLGMLSGLDVGNMPDQIPLDTAKTLATMAYDGMNAQTSRMQALNQGAATGASLLNTRVNAGTSMLNNLLGLAGNKNFGLGGPLPSGLGAGLMSDVGGFATQLGGGDAVYQTAVNLVHAANPSVAGTAQGALAAGILSGMLSTAAQPDASTPSAPATAAPIQPADAQATFQAPTYQYETSADSAARNARNAGTDWLFNSPASPIANPANTPGGAFQAPVLAGTG